MIFKEEMGLFKQSLSGRKLGLKTLGLFLQMFPYKWKRRLGVHLGAPDVRWSLGQLCRFGFYPKQIVDVGAFRGDWARICHDIFPEATITCVEPQEACQEELRKLASQYSNIKVIRTLLGKTEQENVPFKEIGSGSSVLLDCEGGFRKPMTTIDALIADGHCKPPELLKIDVQGYELEILEGYTRSFDCCQTIQIEISLLPIVQGAPLLHEVVNYLYKRGFVMFDVDELIRAPSDGAVWQIDALFCRIGSPLRMKRTWRKKV
jgi:FkbM family methyltransferase